MDDMNDLGPRELKTQDARNSIEFWLIWTILGSVLEALEAMNN